jgi:signal transduction histidine kinase
MTRTQIVRTAILSLIILAIVIVLDYLMNVVLIPGATPYTPLGTIAITVVVAPAFIAYLILQNAKVETARLALAEERLARVAADGANSAKTQFLAAMSHELRTPLNAIIGYAEMIEEELPRGGVTECIEDARRIQRSGRHLLGLIGEILDQVQIEAGTLELNEAPTPLAPLFNEVVEAARAMAPQNGNTLTAECAPDIGVASIDAARLKQCMLNLVNNAAKFTKQGRIKLTLRAGAANELVFVVADTGIGMTRDTITRLFRPFVQADSSVTREYGGAGLGLVITKQLAAVMGGDVTVTSELGAGSAFTLTFRRYKTALRLAA